MGRTTQSEFINDPTYFTALQIQLRSLIEMAKPAVWAERHFVSGFDLLRDHFIGFGIVGIRVEMVGRAGFFDCGDRIVSTTEARVRKEGRILEGFFTYAGTQGTFARVRILYRIVKLAETFSMSAAPGRIDGDLLAKWPADEIDTTPLQREVPERIERARAGKLLAEGEHPFVVHRHLCELSDQWSYVEIPRIVGAGREALTVAEGDRVPELRKALSTPHTRFDVEFQRPLFFLDEASVHTAAYATDTGIAFVHRVYATRSSGETAAAVVEELGKS